MKMDKYIKQVLSSLCGIPERDVWAEDYGLFVKTLHIVDRGNVDRRKVEAYLPTSVEHIVWEHERRACKDV